MARKDVNLRKEVHFEQRSLNALVRRVSLPCESKLFSSKVLSFATKKENRESTIC